MRVPFRRLLWLVPAFLAMPATPQSRVDPKALSIYPFTGQGGTTFTATMRATGLGGAAKAVVTDAPLKISVDRIEADSSGRSKTPVDLVTLRVEVAADAKPGRYPIRLITRNGISNALPIHIVESPVTAEPAGAHETQESAVAVPTVPAVFAGRLSRRGEADYYAFRAEAGQTLTFEVISGLPQIACRRFRRNGREFRSVALRSMIRREAGSIRSV